VDYVLAQVNIGRLLAPLDSPQLADFAAALDPVNAVADMAPGFVWRLQTEALGAYVYGNAHRAVLRRRREWFERMTDAFAALWWIPHGHIPDTREAEDRIKHLRAHGPTPYAFTLREHFRPRAATTPGRFAVRKTGPALSEQQRSVRENNEVRTRSMPTVERP
jgi:hypothetical protein